MAGVALCCEGGSKLRVSMRVSEMTSTDLAPESMMCQKSETIPRASRI